MTDVYLGELEQIVLLAVLRLGDEAYAVPILEQIERADRAQGGARRALHGARSAGSQGLPALARRRTAARARRPRAALLHRHAAAVRALKASRLALLRLWNGLESMLDELTCDSLARRAMLGWPAQPGRARHGPRRSQEEGAAPRRAPGTGDRRSAIAVACARRGASPRAHIHRALRRLLHDTSAHGRSLRLARPAASGRS